jgi:sigma-B regulation protein RsbU (phosphoserine phosphatase)
VLVTAAAQSDYTGRIERGFQISFFAGLVVVLVMVLTGIAIGRWLVAPLRELVNAVERIGDGDLEFETNIDHAPEYNRLGRAINAMIIALRDRLRMRRSLQLASEVQKNLLPRTEPHISGLDIVGHSTYCDETGGDYYDFLDISGSDENEVVVALGDVMGHGVAAAMLMATARGILRSRCAQEGSLAEFLEHLNTLLIPDTQGHRFMTMLLATFNVSSGTLRWASAGHGAPIIYDSQSDSFLDLDGGGIPLGIAETAEYEEYANHVATPGHVILIATDGIWEAKGEDDELYGMDRLMDLIRSLAHLDARGISDGIRMAIADHQGTNEPDDDMTYVVIRVP